MAYPQQHGNTSHRIYRYGLEQWGEGQAERYLSVLKGRLFLLTEQPLIGIERPELLPNVRSFPVERHTLYYRMTRERAEIVRVLHERQDPKRSLDDQKCARAHSSRGLIGGGRSGFKTTMLEIPGAYS